MANFIIKTSSENNIFACPGFIAVCQQCVITLVRLCFVLRFIFVWPCVLGENLGREFQGREFLKKVGYFYVFCFLNYATFI